MAAFMLVVLICLVGLGNLVSSQSTVPTPPTEVPPDTGPPKNYHNCRINADATFSWIVAVYSGMSQIIRGHGSMITYNAFISTCRQYQTKLPYIARGQFIWNLSRPLDPCSQDKQVQQVIKHPKCYHSDSQIFFDYALFKLKQPFDITGSTYPTVGFANDPADLFTEIHYLNTTPNTTGCMLPSFLDQQGRIPVFDWGTFVEVIPFRAQCMRQLCEKSPPNSSYTATCLNNLVGRAEGTQLCVTYKNRTRNIPMGVGNRYWIAGTPLVCNTSTYGIASQPHLKADNPHLTSEIHYVVTLLRVWEWLIQQMSLNSAPWDHRAPLDEDKIKPEHFEEPDRPPIDGSGKPSSPGAHSDAVSLLASIPNIVSASIILYCFNK